MICAHEGPPDPFLSVTFCCLAMLFYGVSQTSFIRLIHVCSYLLSLTTLRDVSASAQMISSRTQTEARSPLRQRSITSITSSTMRCRNSVHFSTGCWGLTKSPPRHTPTSSTS